MTNNEQSIDKQEFIQRIFSAISSTDKDDPNSSTKGVVSSQVTELLINALLQQQEINTEHDPIFPSMSILLKQQLLEQNLKLSAEFFNLVKLIDKLFDNLLIDTYLRKDIKNLLSHIRIPFFKLALNDKTLLTETLHPARLLLNDMIKFGLLCSARDPKTFAIKEQLEVIVLQIVSTSKEQNINKVFSCAEELFKEFSCVFFQRVEIFEKRLRESEEGKARTESSKTSAKELLNKVTCKKRIPFFVLNIFNKAWEQVIFLELVKEHTEEQVEAFETAKQLLVSLQPISNEEELDNFKALQPLLISKLKRGLIKVAYPYSDADKFFEELNDHYESNLAQANIIIQKKASQDIIRLKPTIAFNGESVEIVSEESQSETATKITMNRLNQWVDKVFSELSVDSQNSVSVNDAAIGKKASTSLETLANLQKSTWFELMLEQQKVRVKFTCYIQQSDKFIFDEGAGTKIAEFSSSELNQLFHDKRIKVLDSSSAFDRAYHLVIEEFISVHMKAEDERLFLEQQESRKIKEEQIKAEENWKIKNRLEEAEQQVKEEKAKRNRKAALKNTDLESKEKQPSMEAEQLTEEERNHIIKNISNLALGTRVELEQKNKVKQCQLAAKIASSGKFIFCDLNGNKVMQCAEQDLVDFFKSGQLKFRQKSGIFDEALPTIISSMRNLKLDNK